MGRRNQVRQDTDGQGSHDISGIISFRPHDQAIPVACQVHTRLSGLLRPDRPASCLFNDERSRQPVQECIRIKAVKVGNEAVVIENFQLVIGKMYREEIIMSGAGPLVPVLLV